MSPLVSIEGVRKVFRNGIVALDRVDLDVAKGDFVSLLGPSGCGKSTLLRIIAGLAEPSAGTLRGRERLGSRVSFVFQEPTLMPWATVWDNVYLPLRLAGEVGASVSDRIRSTIAAVGLEGFERSYPRELSGGMKMRVSIARALVTSPELLLLDEPFAALDEINRFKLNEDLLRLWQSHHWTVVFVTHSVFESVFLSNRVIVMTPRPGRIVADIPVDLAYPRASGLRTAPQYTELCRVVSHRLAEGMTV